MTGDDVADFTLGQPEYDVATGQRESAVRTIVTRRASASASRPCRQQRPRPDPRPVAGAQRPHARAARRRAASSSARSASLAALLAGWVVARNGLRPVRRLTSSVEQIAVTEDLTPLPVEGDDEVARLATAFNQMLLALGASRDRQRRLVADAGHELRTPLTSLRTNLDLLRQAEGNDAFPPEARLELLDDVRGQIEELSALVGDLVELARDEPTTHVVAEVDLAEVVERAVTRVRRRAHGVSFDVDLDAWPVVGDASSLERAVTNLLDNAAKWSPADGTVTGAADRRACSPSTTRAPASPRPTAPTSSSASTAPRSRARCPAPGSACRSCGRSSTGTAAASRPPSRRPAGLGSRCGCRACRL